MKKQFGHPKFYEILEELAALHSAKNEDYTKGGDPMGNFNRVAGILAQYPGLDLGKPAVVALVYMLKQLDAVLWMMCQGYEGKVEGVASRLRDVGVYALLDEILHKEAQ